MISAEFLDEKTPDGQLQPGETILLRLDGPPGEGFRPESVAMRMDPPVSGWTPQVDRTDDPELLEVTTVAVAGTGLTLEGVHRRDPRATGLEIDLGDGVIQTVDLQPRRPIPALRRAIWEDSSPAGGNGVLDEGDKIRLVFDQPVKLADGAEGRRVRVPQEILLSRDSLDRLDDGTEHARYVSGEKEDEICILLGSNPFLNLDGRLPENAGAIDRFSSGSPSGIAINGTDILPMPLVVSQRGGPGAASAREVDLEYPESYPRPLGRRNEKLPDPGGRSHHTTTPFAGGYAVVAGGKANATGEALADVLIYYLFHEGFDLPPFRKLRQTLPNPAFLHTATLLPRGNLDEHVVVLAGGFDGEKTLGDLTVVRIRPEGGFAVQPLETSLRFPRAEHAAVAVGKNSLLIDGGRAVHLDGRESLVGCAELLTLELAGDGSTVRASQHALFRSVERAGHTLTLLRGEEGERWVLAYGGFGRNWRKKGGFPLAIPVGRTVDDPSDCLYPLAKASVLASPVLIAVDRPEASITSIDHELRFPYLRRNHRSVGLGGDPDRAPPAAASVLIVGGTLAHPEHGFDGDVDELWEFDPDEMYQRWREIAEERLAGHTEVDLARLPGGRPRRRPEAQHAVHAVHFLFDPHAPGQSRLELISHPAPDPSRAPLRLDSTATYVPGLGVLVTGGHSGSTDKATASIDAYLPGRQLLAPYALRLLVPRSGHEAILVEDAGSRFLLLVGGQSPAGAGEEFADVEQVPLPPTPR